MPVPMDLINTLADLYPETRDARALWERAGGRGREVESNPNARDLWQRLWRQSSQGASVTPEALLKAALADNENNAVLKGALLTVQTEHQAPVTTRAPIDQGVAPELELAALLSSLFSAAELRIFLYHLPGGRELDNALPGAVTPLSELSHEASKLLIKRGHLGDGLFKALLGERPGRAADIEAVKRRLVQ
ncbi:MAG: hypothetical protein IPI35_29020 [Deltaproteobacteria bacterium]|nr:hypothetical protein [Deltaproteobacteria bacterium]